MPMLNTGTSPRKGYFAPALQGVVEALNGLLRNESEWKKLGFSSGNPKTMPRYFFKITNGKPHDDHTGEELRDENAAWQETKRLTRDIEDSLEMNGHWNVEVCDADGPLYSIKIASQKLR